MKIDITDIADLEKFAESFQNKLNKGNVVYLHGDLGSGKTTLVQFIVRYFGYLGRVKSPTYNLYESYSIKDYEIIHMDLYRLANPEELFYLGIEDIFNSTNIVFIEWPEKGTGVLPKANFILNLEILAVNKRELIFEEKSFRNGTIK